MSKKELIDSIFGAPTIYAFEDLRVVDEVMVEYLAASSLHPAFNSAHEGFAILKEEVDELWDEVKKRPSVRELEKMRAEAVQVAAMAIRFIKDCT